MKGYGIGVVPDKTWNLHHPKKGPSFAGRSDQTGTLLREKVEREKCYYHRCKKHIVALAEVKYSFRSGATKFYISNVQQRTGFHNNFSAFFCLKRRKKGPWTKRRLKGHLNQQKDALGDPVSLKGTLRGTVNSSIVWNFHTHYIYPPAARCAGPIRETLPAKHPGNIATLFYKKKLP